MSHFMCMLHNYDRCISCACGQGAPSAITAPQPNIPRPSELFYNKLTPLLKKDNLTSSSENRKDWPLATMKRVLDELMHDTPADLLAK